MPQPLIAVPVFMFASHFIFWQSVGTEWGRARKGEEMRKRQRDR
jgi:hypothetical protein